MARKADGDLREDARRNRAALVAVAREVFAEEGTDASLRDVARRAGVGIGTLYRHFPNRVALLQAVLGDGIDSLRELAENSLSADDPAHELEAWTARFAQRCGAQRGLPSDVMAALQDKDSELHRSCLAMMAAVQHLLEKAQAQGAVSADLDATDVVTMGAAAGWVQYFSGEERSRRMLRVLTNGLQTGRS
ncbi:TetR/AcrR family transcriptional regulator [Kineosporia mesophila]|uniref:TetR/AcrR family transcriptional regulator n=1 Tax=Kineosporia mesophila TaxID=566012 RepID=A0ABP7AV47_9ACTN|nr:TetR/AcrR family transcriptional regulator [Kineosporia mesophila]MCD5352371.1 TetR/AcrR family transcriptional regulator [Kineosporia mesophila]